MDVPNWAKKVMQEIDADYEVLKQKAHDRLRMRLANWDSGRPVNRLLLHTLKRHQTFENLSQWKKGFKSIGKAIGVAIKAKDAAMLGRTINSFDLGAHGVLTSFNKQMLFMAVANKNQDLVDNLFCCTDCGSVHTDNYRYRTDNEDDAICESCVQTNYRWSNEMDCHIRRNHASRYFPTQRSYENGEADWITSEFASSNDIYWNDDIDAYATDNVYANESDSDSGEEYGLQGYHNSCRRFVPVQSKPNALFRNMPPLGLELELYCPDRSDTCYDLQEHFTPIGHLLKELDSSLDLYHGMELITDPLGYEEWNIMGPKLLKQLKKTDCVAYNADHSDNSYGIHITLHRKYLSPLQEARMFLFMVAEENKYFIKAIAQRNGIYGGSMDMGSQSKRYQNVRTIGGLGYEKKVLGAGKYAPINFKGDLAEIRIFQATLHEPSFMKNIEFVWAVVEWVRASSGAKWSYIDFVTWLGQQRGNARHDYPNLYEYLLRPSYRIKKFSASIPNTWSHLMRVPNPNPALPSVALTVSDDSLLAA